VKPRRTAPILAAIRELRGRRPDRGAAAIYGLAALAALIVLLEPVSKRLTSELMRVHHLQPSSLAAWVGLQLVPKMYSFEHTCWIGPPGATADRRERERFWVNHYPARRARFDAGRIHLGLDSDHAVVVRSSYRGTTETTEIRVRRELGRLVWRRAYGDTR
jgi:hypothetical protein